MVKGKIEEIKLDFEFIKHKALAILLFGSMAKGKEARDLDICIVKPNEKNILNKIFRKINVNEKNYDIYIFEELPLYMKMEVIKNHLIIFSKSKQDLYEYFYFYRKLWKDQEKRNKITKEDLFKMLKTKS